MVSVKIECSCGQHYAFDVEPVDGRMPTSIACPKCGLDGTSRANEVILHNLSLPAESLPEVHANGPQPRLAARTPARTTAPIRAHRDDDAVRDLIEAKLDIKRAVSAAVIVSVMDLVLATLSLFGIKILETDLWILLDVVIVGALAYGIYRFSRTCAVLMFIYYLLLCVVMLGKAGLGGVIVRAVFFFYFGTGMMGTFKYHKLNKASR
jgi:uncharacterized membrane protein YjgN (DUF898 family)